MESQSRSDVRKRTTDQVKIFLDRLVPAVGMIPGVKALKERQDGHKEWAEEKAATTLLENMPTEFQALLLKMETGFIHRSRDRRQSKTAEQLFNATEKLCSWISGVNTSSPENSHDHYKTEKPQNEGDIV